MEKPWIVDIQDDLQRLPDPSQDSGHWRKRSIYGIPASSVSDANREPQRVSLGPYHHGRDTLKPMEEHKRRAILHYLKRYDIPLPTLVDALTPVLGDLRDAYDQLDPEWQDDDKFVQMLITDGCFILEILQAAIRGVEYDYAVNDPIFSNHGWIYTIPFLKRDMLMLENQLPILVLEKLVSVQRGCSLETLNSHPTLHLYTSLS